MCSSMISLDASILPQRSLGDSNKDRTHLAREHNYKETEPSCQRRMTFRARRRRRKKKRRTQQKGGLPYRTSNNSPHPTPCVFVASTSKLSCAPGCVAQAWY